MFTGLGTIVLIATLILGKNSYHNRETIRISNIIKNTPVNSILPEKNQLSGDAFEEPENDPKQCISNQAKQTPEAVLSTHEGLNLYKELPVADIFNIPNNLALNVISNTQPRITGQIENHAHEKGKIIVDTLFSEIKKK